MGDERTASQRTHIETFTRDEREIARARHVVARTLHDWGMSGDVPVLEILVSELVTNALVHGDGTIVLCLASDGDRVRLEVSDDDGTPGLPHLVEHPLEGGRGLRLVDQLADRWGAERGHHSTRVWTETRQTGPPRHEGSM